MEQNLSSLVVLTRWGSAWTLLTGVAEEPGWQGLQLHTLLLHLRLLLLLKHPPRKDIASTHVS